MSYFKITTALLLAAAFLLVLDHVQAAPFNDGGENDGDTPLPTKATNTTSEEDQDNEGGSPTNTTTTTTTAPADSGMTTPPVPSETEVRHSAEVTKTAAEAVGTAASVLATYIIDHFLTEEFIQMSPCFAAVRGPQELDGFIRPGINYLQRIVNDRHILGVFDVYMRNVTAFYNASINKDPACDYCVRFSELKRLTTELSNNLENLITEAQLRGLQVDEEDLPQQQTLEEHCMVPCFDNQASIYRFYRSFAMSYVVTDINGFLEQSFDSDKD